MPKKKEDKNVISAEFENNVIQKQRKELQQMVQELRDRDRELNDLVSSHQRQMAAWETDRRKFQQIEEKVKLLESQLSQKNGQIASLTDRLQQTEKKLSEKSEQKEELRRRHEKLARQNEQQKRLLEELEEHCDCLERKFNDASMNAEMSSAQRQELLSEIKKKDDELSLRFNELHDTVVRFKACEARMKSQDQGLRQMTVDLEETRARSQQYEKMNDSLKEEVKKFKKEFISVTEEKERSRHELSKVKKENQLLIERDARKDEILLSHRLRQERNESELAHLRQLYERMHQELADLQCVGDVMEDNVFMYKTSYDKTHNVSSVPYQPTYPPLAYGNSPQNFMTSSPSHTNHVTNSNPFPSNGFLLKVNSSPDLANLSTVSQNSLQIATHHLCSTEEGKYYHLETSRSITEKCNQILNDMNS